MADQTVQNKTSQIIINDWDQNGGVPTIPGTFTPSASGSSISRVAGNASSVTLKTANTSRKMLTLFNDSTAILYVKLGATAAVNSYTIQMAPGSYYEIPGGYNGIVDGIWSAANGFAYITEVT